MREYFRPYNKIITISDTDQHNVILTDSSGGPLECNYVAVSVVSSTTDNDYFQVVPSGINTIFGGEYTTSGVYDTYGNLSGRDQGPSGYPNASTRTSNSASGVLGILTDSAAGTAILILGTYDTTKAIILTQNAANPATYAVTYGQVILANNVADSRVDMGEQTWTP